MGLTDFCRYFGGQGVKRGKVPARSYETTGEQMEPWERPAMGTGPQKCIRAGERPSSLALHRVHLRTGLELLEEGKRNL